MGAISLILGLIGMASSLYFASDVEVFWGNTALWFIPIIASAAGIVLGAMGRKKGEGGIATGGMVVSIVAAAISVLLWWACTGCISSL